MSRVNKTFYEVTNKSAETKTVDILMYGAIPDWEEDSWKMKNTAEKFVKEFKALEKDYDRINIRINSPGGSTYHGFPIFNAIASSKKDIHTYNDGLAASMGGLLLLAGKTVHSAKNGLLMIHNALVFAIGNAEDIRETAAMLEKYDGVIAQHFADKSGQSIEDIKTKFLNYKDHYLTADEAKAEGFVDVIEDYESEDAPPSDISNMVFGEVLNLYKEKSAVVQEQSFFAKVTEHVRNVLSVKPKAEEAAPVISLEETPSPDQPTTTHNEPPMDFKNSLDILNKESITPEDVAALKAEISNFTGANEKFTADEVQAQVTEAVTPVQANLDNITAEKDGLVTEVANLKANVSTLNSVKDNLEKDIQAYRKSGVQIANASGADPDPIEGEDTTPSYYSEADAEMDEMRAQAKL